MFFGRSGALEPVVRQDWGAKTEILRRLTGIANTGIVVDVGANVGQTMVATYAFDRSARYHGFEPNPEAFVGLQQVAKANGFPAVLFPWACADRAMPLQLFSAGGTDMAATVKQDIRESTYGQLPGMWIPAYPLDMLEAHMQLDSHFILKIDTEGAEFDVLVGASSIIRKYRPAILCEVLNAHSDAEMARNDINKVSIENFLKSHGYRIYANVFGPQDYDGQGTLLGLSPIAEMTKRLLYRDAWNANDYLFVPNEFPDIRFSAS